MNDLALAPRLLHEDATERLRDMIVQGDLAPGAKLVERVLCERLGVSRTPLREAIKRLASEGLVELQPNRGAIVTPLTLEQVRETFAVMGALEALAGQLACRNITDAQLAEIRALHFEMLACHARGDLAGYFRCNQAIHLAIVAAGGNGTLAATYRHLNAHVLRARYMANLSRERWDRAVAEHEAMLNALAARDGERLQRLLSEHLGAKMMAVLAAVQSTEGASDAAYD
ncbi:MAG TPA: GntR family transcriptional regulator [Burkholderiales bacterium]|nr:GntR family transcriptional regulator [Burkholderiales bacterium]